MDHKRKRQLKRTARAYGTSVVLVLFVMSTGWLADSILDKEADFLASLYHLMTHSPARLVLPAVLVIVFGHVLWFLRRGLMPAQNLALLQPIPRCRAILFSLSDLARGKRLDFVDGKPVLFLPGATGSGTAQPGTAEPRASGERCVPLPVTLSEATRSDNANPYSSERISWQQVLKGIKPHLGRVSRIVLIASHENRQLSELALRWLAFYLGDSVQVECHPESANFEDVNDLYFALSSVVERLQSESFRESDIMIDATGGTKVASIAAALATLTYKNLKFQYVTNTDKVIAFNATFANEPDLA